MPVKLPVLPDQYLIFLLIPGHLIVGNWIKEPAETTYSKFSSVGLLLKAKHILSKTESSQVHFPELTLSGALKSNVTVVEGVGEGNSFHLTVSFRSIIL